MNNIDNNNDVGVNNNDDNDNNINYSNQKLIEQVRIDGEWCKQKKQELIDQRSKLTFLNMELRKREDECMVRFRKIEDTKENLENLLSDTCMRSAYNRNFGCVGPSGNYSRGGRGNGGRRGEGDRGGRGGGDRGGRGGGDRGVRGSRRGEAKGFRYPY